MAAYDLEEQEKIDELKSWWGQYGNQLLNILIVIFSVVIAWQGWNWYQRRQVAQASMVYYHLQDAIQKKDIARVKAMSGELLEKFDGSSYASLGALLAAKSFVESGEVKTAKAQLQWIVDNDKDDLRDFARLRLAAILIDEKSYDDAFKQLDGKVAAVFEARFLDTRGDILKIQGKIEEARDTYRLALVRLGETRTLPAGLDLARNWQAQADEIYRETIQQKLDALGGAR